MKTVEEIANDEARYRDERKKQLLSRGSDDEPKKQLLIRVPAGLHMLVGSLARMSNTTMNDFVETAIVNEIKTNHCDTARLFGQVFEAQIVIGDGLRKIFENPDDTHTNDGNDSASSSAENGIRN